MELDLQSLLDKPCTAEELEICRIVREQVRHIRITAEALGAEYHTEACIFLEPLRIDFCATTGAPTQAWIGPQKKITKQDVASKQFWDDTLKEVRKNFRDFIDYANSS